MVDELRWLIGLNLVLAIWLGMLADSWKGRRMYVWIGIGLCTSVAGLVVLALLPKCEQTRQENKSTRRYLPTDSYGH